MKKVTAGRCMTCNTLLENKFCEIVLGNGEEGNVCVPCKQGSPLLHRIGVKAHKTYEKKGGKWVCIG